MMRIIGDLRVQSFSIALKFKREPQQVMQRVMTTRTFIKMHEDKSLIENFV